MIECKEINQRIKRIIRIMNYLTVVIILFLLFSIFISKLDVILTAIVIMAIVYTFVLGYKISSLIEKYIRNNHLEKFTEYQNENLFFDMTNQRYTLFIESKYFKIRDNNEEMFKNVVNRYIWSIYILLGISLISLFISVILHL